MTRGDFVRITPHSVVATKCATEDDFVGAGRSPAVERHQWLIENWRRPWVARVMDLHSKWLFERQFCPKTETVTSDGTFYRWRTLGPGIYEFRHLFVERIADAKIADRREQYKGDRMLVIDGNGVMDLFWQGFFYVWPDRTVEVIEPEDVTGRLNPIWQIASLADDPGDV